MTMRLWKTKSLMVASAACHLFASAALATEPFRHLTGREITSRFTGMELTDEVHWAYVFEKAGRLKSFSMGKASTGTWKVEKDELCLDRPPDEPRCYEVWTAGRNVQLRYEPALPEEAILQKPQKRQ